MACKSLPSWEQQVCAAGVGWLLRHQTEHPHLERGAIIIPNILHLVTKPGRPGSLGREEVVRGRCQPLLSELRAWQLLPLLCSQKQVFKISDIPGVGIIRNGGDWGSFVRTTAMSGKFGSAVWGKLPIHSCIQASIHLAVPASIRLHPSSHPPTHLPIHPLIHLSSQPAMEFQRSQLWISFGL